MNLLFLRNRTPRGPLCPRIPEDSRGLPHDWFERLEATKNPKRFGTKLVSILDQFWVPCWADFQSKNYFAFFRYIVFMSVLCPFFGRCFNHFYMFLIAFLDIRPAVVATPLLFTDVRFTKVKRRFVTTMALNRHYIFKIFLFDING